MRTVGLGLWFEDYAVGDRFRTVGRTVTETDIVNFVNCTGDRLIHAISDTSVKLTLPKAKISLATNW